MAAAVLLGWSAILVPVALVFVWGAVADWWGGRDR